MIKYELNSKYDLKFRDYLFDIEIFFTQNDTTIHKARNELKVIKFGGISSIVKSFKVPNIINKIAYTYFRDSKAKKSYLYSLKIAEFTPSPIGYIEFFKNGLIDNSYFISEEFRYDFTIREPLLDKSFKDREEIFKAFARFTFELHNKEIFHNDYSPGNILIKKDKTGYIFKIVDINRMKFTILNAEKRAENFSKLWASEDELNIISDEYLKYYDCSIDFKSQVIYYSQKNKKIKNFKKRLKGKKIND